MATSALAPRRYRWTRAEYDRAVAAGAFSEDSGIELIDGELLETKVTPQGPPHAWRLTRVAQLLATHYGFDRLRIQLPLGCGRRSEPEPDVVVVPDGAVVYATVHPTTAVLVVEVSDSSLWFDRTEKARIYAEAGMPTYWIIDVEGRAVEVCTDPGAVGYKTIRRYTTGELLPGVTVDAIFSD